MTLFQAVLLGLLQGLTEFLPVSSSGHLVIAQYYLGFTSPPVVFDVLVHVATALAVIIIMWPVIIKLNRRLVSLILLASFPAAFVGLFLNSQIETLFSSLTLVGLALLITSLILFLTKFIKKSSPVKLSLQNTFIIGLFQALAIIPGISRSGSTISAGFFQGLKPQAAFNFSFLLSLPAILGAQLLQLNEVAQISPSAFPSLAIGFLTAFFSGLIALKFLKKIVIQAQLHWFSLYCFALGLFILLI